MPEQAVEYRLAADGLHLAGEPKLIGTTLQNRYRLETELGQGGMGVVYRAHDLLLDRDVAVKILGDAGLSPEGSARLLREARAAAQLNHPNIVAIHDAGEVDGSPFIVMELVEGESLFKRPPQSLSEILSVARQICAALDHAHAHHIIHRDLKPENVLIAADGSAKLMDFGLARSRSASRQTKEGTLVGTVFYLAPEQALGQEIDHRADLYALGVMLYEMATGRLPFDGDDPLAVIAQHVHAPPELPSAIRPGLPPVLESLILNLLAKNPADRFASAGEVAAALAKIAGDALPPRPAAAPRHNLPIQLTSFIGREKEMAEVKRLLASSSPGGRGSGGEGLSGAESRLLTLTGPGGTGKTRLGLQAAADLLDSFPDGVWLIELASLADPALVPPTVATVLGVREEPGRPVLAVITDYLRNKNLLLILDNCEHLVEACAELAETLLRACPNLKILASSREVLGIAGETSFRVPSLSLPDPQQLPPLTDLTQYEAIQLFIDRARVVNPDFALTEANANAIAQTCQRLDGIPLAIELAAVRVRAMSVEQIAARLDDRFRLLTGGSRTALPRQQTLRALIDWSWDLLSEAERVLLRRLSVFWGGWTLEAAEFVCGGVGRFAWGNGSGVESPTLPHTPAPTLDVLELLTHLVDKSLVMVEEQGEGTRYQLLETIRQYTKDKLFESGEAEQIRAGHLEFFLALAEEAEPSLRTGEQLTCLNRLELEHDNLRAALKWARGSGNWDAGLRLAGALARFWYLRGHWREGREWLAKMLSESAANAPSSKAARARALYGAGWLADEQGPEFEFYTESLALSRELGQAGRWGEAFSLRGLGASATNRVEPEQAAAFLNESLAVFRELNDTWGIALVLFNLGWLASSQEGNTEAQNHWDESLRLFRQTGDRWGIAVTLGALGYLARTQGAYQRAAAMTEEGLSLFRELGDKAGMAISLTRLGNVALRRGDYRQAIVLLEKSLALQQERGDQRGIGALLGLLGLVMGYQGDYPLAVAKLEESLALSREVGDEETTGYTLSYLGLMTYYQGDFEQATTLWQESLAWHREREDKGGIALALNGLGLVAHSRGDQTQAAALLEESLTLFKEVGDKRYIAIALNGLGRVAHVQGDEAHAAALFKKSLSLRKEMGARRGVAESLEGVAGVTAGQPEKAVRLLAIAQAVRDKIGAPRPPVEHTDYDCTLTALRAQLSEERFAAAWAEGQAMKLEKAIAQALE